MRWKSLILQWARVPRHGFLGVGLLCSLHSQFRTSTCRHRPIPMESPWTFFPLHAFNAGGLFTMRPPCDTDTCDMMENTLLDE